MTLTLIYNLLFFFFFFFQFVILFRWLANQNLQPLYILILCLSFQQKTTSYFDIYISNNCWYVKYLLNLNPLCNSISTNFGLFAVKAIVITSCHPVSWIMRNIPNTNSLSVRQKEMLSQTLNITKEKVFTTSSKMSYFFACLGIFKYFVFKKFKSDN